MLPIMLALYNVRFELEKDFDGTLREIAGIGYKYVELALAKEYGKTALEFKASLDKAGLTAISAHVPLSDMILNPDKAISFHMDIGCKYIVVPYLSEEDRSTGPNYENMKKEIARLGEEVNKKNGVLLYHNHEFEFVDYKGKYALDDIYDSIPANLLKAQIDVCWTKVAGVDPVQYLLKYSGRTPIVHLKDYEFSGDAQPKADYDFVGETEKARNEGHFPFRAVGHGCQDFPAIIKAAEKAGAKWLVVEQDLPSPGKTSLECAKESYDFLNRTIS